RERERGRDREIVRERCTITTLLVEQKTTRSYTYAVVPLILSPLSLSFSSSSLSLPLSLSLSLSPSLSLSLCPLSLSFISSYLLPITGISLFSPLSSGSPPLSLFLSLHCVGLFFTQVPEASRILSDISARTYRCVNHTVGSIISSHSHTFVL